VPQWALVLRQLDQGQRATQVATNMSMTAETPERLSDAVRGKGWSRRFIRSLIRESGCRLDTGQSHRVTLCALTVFGLA
jgi:hypothetical protein